MTEDAWLSTEPLDTFRAWLPLSHCCLRHAEQNLTQTNTSFGTIFKNRAPSVPEPTKFLELPAPGTGPWCLGYYRLGKLGPLLLVAKRGGHPLACCSWEGTPGASWDFWHEARLQRWCALAPSSCGQQGIQESNELSPELASLQAEIKVKPVWNGRCSLIILAIWTDGEPPIYEL